MEIFYIIFIALLGSFVQSISGFGFGILVMSLWPIVLSLQSAVIVELITALVMVAYISFKLYKHINFKMMLYPLFTSIITSAIGIRTLVTSSETLLRRILGGVLILMALYFIFFSERFKIKPTKTNGIIAGGLSGFLSGLLGMGGPPIAAYFMSVSEDKLEYSATLQCYFLLSSSYAFLVHIFMGNITIDIVRFSLAGIIGVIIGTTTGFSIFKKLPMGDIKKFLYAFILAIGIFMLIKG